MPTFEELQQPEYLHVLLNHLPIYGLAVALLSLALALVTRNRGAQWIALVCVLVTAGSAWPVYASGEAAYKPVRRVADEAGTDWLDAHMDRAEETIFTFAILAGLAALALVLPRFWPKTATILAVLTLVAGCGCLGVGTYVAYAGGKIRHPELRHSPPPKSGDEDE